MSRISSMYYVSETSPTRPLPTTEGLNFAHRPHPNWPVIFGHTSAGKLPNKSGCRLQAYLAGWEFFHQSCWELRNKCVFSQQSPKMLKIASESFIPCCCWFQAFFSKFPVGCPCLFLFAVVLFIKAFVLCYDRLFSCFFQFGGHSHRLNFVKFLDTALYSCFG